MTGYGKAEALLGGGKLIVEIRTLNGKTADINLKSQLLPKDRELEIRARLAQMLVRGTIDVFLTWEPDASDSGRQINMDIARAYMHGAMELASEMGLSLSPEQTTGILSSVLRMPEVAEVKKTDVLGEENWPEISAAFDRCIDMVCDYRSREGKALYADVTSRVATIVELYDKIEMLEPERIDNIRKKIAKAAEDAAVKMDVERFEQEMIFYLEKLDINEEKVRLRQHCKYFMDTIDSEEAPGKKLVFIIQEMGREINTTGSKANCSEIQQYVVRMKDELEKIREQSMNIL